MKTRTLLSSLPVIVLISLVAGLLGSPLGRPTRPVSAAGGEQVIYGDALAAGWENWSWDTAVNFAVSNPVFSGSNALSVQYTAVWAGLYLHSNTLIPGSDYDTLHFWIHGGGGNQRLEVKLADASLNFPPGSFEVTAQANSWQQVSIPLSSLGSPGQISGVVWQDVVGAAQPTFYLDQVSFINSNSTPTPTPPPGTGPALSVAAAGQRAISPNIYGINFASEALADDLDLPVRRYGGNATTRYNYLNDTANHASDWYFENIPNDNANPAVLPDGSETDRFVEQDRRTGTQTILTVPLIGWTPKARAYACGFSVDRYGAQQSTDPWRPDCGNGVRTNGTEITGNDPLDTSAAITPGFVQGWISHLISNYGPAAQGGVQFYNLDNEPMLWNDTHRDVHPAPASYDELRDRTYQYAAAIKAADPGAKTLGPVLWGWTAYFYSALDWEPGRSWWNNPQDRNAHGGVPFVPWYLGQMQAYDQQNGVRILDYLDLHYYPQASGVALSSAGSAATQALRLRSTRSLWDPGYVDESWINEPVYLIPRMRQWVDQNYPGTLLAITEYNWGALDHINGALAQADVLGIFGREGLDLAALWAPPADNDPGAFAFRIYRNYDGAGGMFGETGVQASSADQEKLSVYASRRSADNALTLVVINKTGGSLTSALSLSGLNPGSLAQVYRYSAANLNAIVPQAAQPVTPAGFSASYPANSITLFVIPSGSGATPTATFTPTHTPAPTNTPTPTATRTLTPIPTQTNTPTPIAYIHLAGLSGSASLSGSKWTATVIVTIHNTNHQPLANATVTGSWSYSAKGTATCTTNSSGQCTISKAGLSTRTARVKFTVTNVTRAGYVYQSSTNDTANSIVVNKP